MEESVRKLVLQRIRSYRDELLDFTKALMAVPTENPPGKAYKKCEDGYR